VSSWFYYKKFVMMHCHMDVKLSIRLESFDFSSTYFASLVLPLIEISFIVFLCAMVWVP